ncbi:MAG: DUF2344 domain-containing protein [Lachnospiraceae bacterium]|nr:DUF2344 domain-containing protein [Lachnospiraceae bacterium]
MKIRMKYTKTGVLKYIGHLDMMRYFQKLLRRSGMDIGFTQGFSPHPEISIALPLGIGVTSEAEYLDVTFNSCGHSKDMIAMLNENQVEGVRILSFKQVPDGRRNNCMAIVSAARYQIFLSEELKAAFTSQGISIGEKLSDMMAKPELTIKKKTKRSEQETDIRPLVYDASLIGDVVLNPASSIGNDSFSPVSPLEDVAVNPASTSGECIQLLLAAGSTNSLNPDTFMRAFTDYCGIDLGEIPWHIHRTEIYTGDKGSFVPLDSLGEDV